MKWNSATEWNENKSVKTKVLEAGEDQWDLKLQLYGDNIEHVLAVIIEDTGTQHIEISERITNTMNT